MSNYACECRTFRYTSSEQMYAKIFSINKSKLNMPSYSNASMVFNLYHGQTNLIKKQYYVFANTNGIKFKDLTPEIKGIECVYELDENTLNFYVKGSLVGSDIKLKVEQANALGFVDFYPFERFTTTLIAPINASYDEPIYLQTKTIHIESLLNEWQIDRDCKIKHSLNTVSVNIVGKNGVVSGAVVIYTLPESLRPKHDYTFTGLGRMTTGEFYPIMGRVYAATGNIQVVGLQSNNQIILQFTYVR